MSTLATCTGVDTLLPEDNVGSQQIEVDMDSTEVQLSRNDIQIDRTLIRARVVNRYLVLNT